MNSREKVSVLFVCLGNICRSPTAEGLFHRLLAQEGLEEVIRVDSAGTGSWHVGKPPDSRSQAAARQRGHDISGLRARQVSPDDFARFDYIIAMDEQNLAELEAMKPADFQGHLGLLLDFGTDGDQREVPDPYFGGEEGFHRVFELVEGALEGLLEDIREKHLSR